ncbi:8153_t:CDS:2, partial [Cetraspora pellucida]
EPEELAISNGALYMVAATDDVLYDDVQGDFVVNDVLYNSQDEFDVINDFLHGIDQDKYENGNMMNFEGAQHESTVVYNDWHQTISEGVQGVELQTNTIFLNWDHAMKEVEKYAKSQGFRFRCYRVEKSNETIRRRTLVCEHYGKPEATKNKNPEKETSSKRVGCTWQVNLLCPEKNNPHKVVYVTKLIDEHKNHDLDREHYDFQESLEFTTDMVNDVEFFVTKMNCSPQQIHKALEEKYCVKIYMLVLHRIIWRFRSKSRDHANDAGRLYDELLKKKESDPRWYVEVDWDPDSKCLRRLFYMSPDQIERWLKFGDVILNDNTSSTNRYEMALSLFLVVDNHLSSRLVAQALTDDETKEAHCWILQQIKKATSEAVPHVMFTDADPALVAAIRDEFPTVNAFHCMFHIAQNIPLNLKNSLKDRYDEFIKNFFKVQRSSFITIFEYKWKCLIEKYNNENVVNYLQRMLYVNKESWAKAFVLKLFTAGMSSTSRVESYNSKIKRLIFNSNTTLLELAEKLSLCILEEDKRTEYALFRASIPKTVLVTTADTILPNVCNMLRKYLTVEMLKIQEDQIKQALHYHGVIVNKNELQRYFKINLDDPALFDNSPSYTDIIAKSMLSLVDNNKILEMWGVRQVISNDIRHFVVLLDDGTHLCSCFDHCNRGIVCRHFFQIMLCSRAATFHIQLIRSRWYNDNETSNNSAHDPFLVAQKFEMEQPVTSWSGPVPYLNALVQVQDMHNINRKMIDKRKLYGEAWGKARAALMIAVRRNDHSFIAMLDKYIDNCNELSSDSDTASSSESDDNHNGPEKGKLNPSELMNPHKRKGKGRPKGTGRIRRAGEPSKKTKRQLHCKICDGAGHNRATCSRRQE